MASNINADTSGGLKLTSDTSGQLELQSAGSTKVTVDTSGNMTVTGNVTATDVNATNVNATDVNATDITVSGDITTNKALGSFSTNTGQTTLTTSYTIMNIGTENKNTGEFTLSSSQVTVNKTGTYLVMYRLTTDCTSGSARTESQAQLYKNATAVQGTFGGMYNRLSGRGLSTCSSQIILDITSGDIFDVRALKTGSDTVVQAQNGINLNFIEL